MGFIDIILYIGIAILYNLVVHNFASMTFKDLQYEEKHENTLIMLVIFGILGIAISKLFFDKRQEYKNSVVSKGLFYGGILLILTALFANWENIAEEMKLFLVVGIFGYLIWYSFKRDVNLIKKKQQEGIINEEIIDNILKENEKK